MSGQAAHDATTCPVHKCPWRHEPGLSFGFTGLHCQWDGSLHPDTFMELIESGAARLTPTDKNYKVYIEMDVESGADSLRIVSMANHKPEHGDYRQAKDLDISNVDLSGWGAIDPEQWIQLGPVGVRRTDKFYFEHLSDEQKTRFLELLKEGKLRLNYPGHFYRLPFFIEASRG